MNLFDQMTLVLEHYCLFELRVLLRAFFFSGVRGLGLSARGVAALLITTTSLGYSVIFLETLADDLHFRYRQSSATLTMEGRVGAI